MDASSEDGLGGSYFWVSNLALPLPSFFPFKALSIAIDWTTFTSEVLPRFLGVFEGGEGVVVGIDLCFVEVEEVLLEV